MTPLEYRQHLVDAAVEELRRQAGGEVVEQHGTHVQLECSFKMARVLEAVFRETFHTSDGLTDAVARQIGQILEGTGTELDSEQLRYHAIDLLTSVEGWLVSEMDPLP